MRISLIRKFAVFAHYALCYKTASMKTSEDENVTVCAILSYGSKNAREEVAIKR